eukprot:1148234-Pelagomonas_calceolata.AAC.3
MERGSLYPVSYTAQCVKVVPLLCGCKGQKVGMCACWNYSGSCTCPIQPDCSGHDAISLRNMPVPPLLYISILHFMGCSVIKMKVAAQTNADPLDIIQAISGAPLALTGTDLQVLKTHAHTVAIHAFSSAVAAIRWYCQKTPQHCHKYA